MILGSGGFDGRLMKTLRDQYGYTYGAYSNLAPATEAGAFSIAFSTQKANTAPALAAAQKVLADFVAEGPTEAELQQGQKQFGRRLSFALRHQRQIAAIPEPDRLLQPARRLSRSLSQSRGRDKQRPNQSRLAVARAAAKHEYRGGGRRSAAKYRCPV